jgi:predicted dehydrogenase
MVKVGFLGCGGMLQHHMRILKNIEDVEFTGMCDIERERAEYCAKEFGGRAYVNFEEMLKEEEMDALFISVPPFAHNNYEILAAEKGINLFIEKPIGLNLENAKKIEKLIKEKGIICSVGYRWRYLEISEKVKEILKNNPPAMFIGYWIGGMPGVNWWREKKKSGGQMVEQTTHIVDLARYFLGEIERVSASFSQIFLHKEVEKFDVWDVGCVSLYFENGIVGSISNTCILDFGYKVGLVIVCKNLVIEHSGGKLRIVRKGEIEEISNQNDDVYEEDRIFIEAVKTKNQNIIKSDYSDALKTFSATIAMNISAEEKREVFLSELK